MKKFFLLFFVLIFLCSCATSEKSPQVVYTDENMQIAYVGIIQQDQPWMTNTGIKNKEIQNVVLEISNSTSTAYFVSGSSLIVDDVDVSPILASLKIWPNTTKQYLYCSENLNNTDPHKISMSLYVFDINDNTIFEPYDIQLDFVVEE